MFCDKHQHAFVNVCSECAVERIKDAQHTVQGKRFKREVAPKQIFYFELFLLDRRADDLTEVTATSLVEAYAKVQDYIASHPEWVVIAVEFLESEPA